MDLTPEAMSPRELADVVVAPLPYGLTWPQLAPALPWLDVASMERCVAYRKFAKQGRFQGSDSSSIVTVEYPTVAGPSSTRTLFVKETPPAQPEAAHYALLKASRVPTPELLAAVVTDGRR